MKISSQLANNFDYCSAEIRTFIHEKFFTSALRQLKICVACEMICK
jgi:hypothetical protein